MTAKKPIKTWNEKCYDIIHEPYKNSRNFGIKEEWLAGLILVENANLKAEASRFEPHVYEALLVAKGGGTAKAFPGFSSGAIYAYIRQVHEESQLKVLATSYGLGQIMGYHYLNKWGVRPEAIPMLSVAEQIDYTLRMMGTGLGFARSNGVTMEEKEYAELMRWWNTGSINGRTYHADYAKRAYAGMISYRKFLEGRGC